MAARRQDIQKAAYDLVGVMGLEALTARSVAQELQINHATVHYYFPQRIDLLVGVAEFALEQFKSDRAKFQAAAKSPIEKLEAELALAEAYCKKTSRFVKVLAGLYVASTANPGLKKKLQLIWKEWVGVVTDLATASKLKKDSPYKDPEALVATLFGYALASHMLDGKFDAKAKIDRVYESLIG